MRRERGIALLAAIVILAIATTIAVGIQFRNSLAMLRGIGANNLELTFQAQGAAEAIAAFALADDAKGSGNQFDHRGERWAAALGPEEVFDGVAIAGQVTDLDGRFNVNSLVDDSGVKDSVSYEIFERLLRILDVPMDVADKLIDYIDADQQPEPNGGEDSLYTSLSPPSRTPNRPIVRVSELRALAGFSVENFRKLQPYVSALPRNERAINLCTASGQLLDAMANQSLWAKNQTTLLGQRKSGCYPKAPDFQGLFGANPQDLQKIQGRFKEQSSYFELRSIVTVGNQSFALYSLMLRSNGGGGRTDVRVLSRALAD
jgi:general secretion pathway protein K